MLNELRDTGMNRNTIILLALLVLSVLANIVQYNRSAPVKDHGVTESIIDQELQRSREEAHYFKLKADSAMLVAEHLEQSMSILEKKSKKTDAKLIQDLAAWRTLPADERVRFFTEELAKVDTIAGW